MSSRIEHLSKKIVGQMNNKTLVFLFVICFHSTQWLYAQGSTPNYPSSDASDSTAIIFRKPQYLKFAIFPFLYSSIFRNEQWLIVHYELGVKKTPLSISGVVEYDSWTFRQSIGTSSFINAPGNFNLWLRPQIRYYLSRRTLSGFYSGVFPVVLYRDILEPQRLNGYYVGAGLTFGYQLLFRSRYPVDFNLRISQQNGYVKSVDVNGVPGMIHDSLLFGFVEINIGLRTR